MDNNQKYCPLIRQACGKDRCEFFNDLIKRCQISVLSYNTYRLAESFKGNVGNRGSQNSQWVRKNPDQRDPSTELPFNG